MDSVNLQVLPSLSGNLNKSLVQQMVQKIDLRAYLGLQLLSAFPWMLLSKPAGVVGCQ
jgi:hypothetical protein